MNAPLSKVFLARCIAGPLIMAGGFLAGLPEALAQAPAKEFKVMQHPDAVTIQAGDGSPLLRYQLQLPSDSRLSVESACYFHPVQTPSGVVVTDVAPSDHLHHRGIFLAWVEMHGSKKADFWGWGEHAPKQGRRIVNRAVVDLVSSRERAGFTARNDWLAEDTLILKEKLVVSARQVQGEDKTGGRQTANLLELAYHLVPQTELVLTQWAFSGFCVRVRKEGEIEARNPEGVVALPNPRHTDPKSNWPDAPWYAYTLKLEDGTMAGVAVLNHPSNPPATWHNHREVRMLNPCIVAPASVKSDPRHPLVLRYRVVVYDGPLPQRLLASLSDEWRVEPEPSP